MWIKRDPNVDLGFLPNFLSEADPRPAREQLDANYQHGGGWKPFEGFEFKMICHVASLLYLGDPPMRSVAFTTLREEIILLFPHDWVVVLQPDGSWEVSRMD